MPQWIHEPDANAVLQEISGRSSDGSFLESYDSLKPDGSTACGSRCARGRR